MTELLHRVIPEHPVEGKPLGRHLGWDPRSKNFPVRKATTNRTVHHRRYVPPFDQGSRGSCTGNAGVGCVATTPMYGKTAKLRRAGLVLDEAKAVDVYTLATQIDGIPGSYPSEDTGSTGLAACQAMLKMGLIGGYRHAFDLDGIISALQVLPGMGGFNWYDSMDEPDWYGRVKISPNASVRGGHEWEFRGVNVTDRYFECVQSWGPDWGKGGYFTIGWDDVARLLDEQGDYRQPLPIGVSA